MFLTRYVGLFFWLAASNFSVIVLDRFVLIFIIFYCTTIYIKQKIRLIDYELMANEQKQRLVLFGKHAGYAGMIDGVHGLGQRLLGLGFSSPFLVSISSLSLLVIIGNDNIMNL